MNKLITDERNLINKLIKTEIFNSSLYILQVFMQGIVIIGERVKNHFQNQLILILQDQVTFHGTCVDSVPSQGTVHWGKDIMYQGSLDSEGKLIEGTIQYKDLKIQLNQQSLKVYNEFGQEIQEEFNQFLYKEQCFKRINDVYRFCTKRNGQKQDYEYEIKSLYQLDKILYQNSRRKFEKNFDFYNNYVVVKNYRNDREEIQAIELNGFVIKMQNEEVRKIEVKYYKDFVIQQKTIQSEITLKNFQLKDIEIRRKVEKEQLNKLESVKNSNLIMDSINLDDLFKKICNERIMQFLKDLVSQKFQNFQKILQEELIELKKKDQEEIVFKIAKQNIKKREFQNHLIFQKKSERVLFKGILNGLKKVGFCEQFNDNDYTAGVYEGQKNGLFMEFNKDGQYQGFYIQGQRQDYFKKFESAKVLIGNFINGKFVKKPEKENFLGVQKIHYDINDKKKIKLFIQGYEVLAELNDQMELESQEVWLIRNEYSKQCFANLNDNNLQIYEEDQGVVYQMDLKNDKVEIIEQFNQN